MRDFLRKHLWILRFLIEKHFTVTWENKNLIRKRCLRKTINLVDWKLFKYLPEAIEKFSSQGNAIRRWTIRCLSTVYYLVGWALGESKVCTKHHQKCEWNPFSSVCCSQTIHSVEAFRYIYAWKNCKHLCRYCYTIHSSHPCKIIHCSLNCEDIILQKSFYSLFLDPPTSFFPCLKLRFIERLTYLNPPRSNENKSKFV